MSNTLLATVVIAGIVGASSAAVTGALMAPSESENQSRAVVEKADLASPNLAAEFASLRQQNTELADRIMELEMQAAIGGTETRREASVAAVDPQMEEMKAEMASLLATMKGSSDEIPASFTATVTTALADIREQEEVERDRKRTERRSERTEDRLAELAEKLGLDQTQVNDLRDHTVAFEEKRQAAFKEARELGDFGAMRETMGAMRDENNTALKSIFSPSQYEQYEEENLGGRGGFGGGGRRGGGDSSDGGATSGGGSRRGGNGGGSRGGF